MTDSLTSIIVPMFNESSWILRTLTLCCDLQIKKEIIVVDNNSSDGSHALVEDFIEQRNLQGEVILLSEEKKGKANAVRKGLSVAKGEYIVFHDADLEYDPRFIPQLVHELRDCDVVIGCRNCRPYSISLPAFIANKVLLKMIQKKYSMHISDIFTAQRGFKRSIIYNLHFTSKSFEMETELSIRALEEGYKVKEIDVTYSPRSRDEGKKIGLRDFVLILWKYYSVGRQITLAKRQKLCEVGVMHTTIPHEKQTSVKLQSAVVIAQK